MLEVVPVPPSVDHIADTLPAAVGMLRQDTGLSALVSIHQLVLAVNIQRHLAANRYLAACIPWAEARDLPAVAGKHPEAAWTCLT